MPAQPIVRRLPLLGPAVLAAALCTACAGGGGGGIRLPSAQAPATTEAASPLEGEWTLTAMQLGDGSSRRVSGFLRFDRFSNLTMHAELAADDPAARPPRMIVADFTAKAAPANGEFDFAGLSMGVGAERLTADAVTMDAWRYYEVAGNTLRVFVRDGAGRAAATLVFQKAR